MAPLNAFFDTCFTLFLEGLTGTYKSSLIARCLNHYGETFEYNRLPIGWNSTENKLEKLLFLLKDLPLVIDDWAPGQNSKEAKDLEQKAGNIFRAQANRLGRSRMSSDTTSRMTYNPRGFLITSGEHSPEGGSGSSDARTFSVQIQKEISTGLNYLRQ